MKKITLIVMMVAGIGLTAFRNSDKLNPETLAPDIKIKNPIGTQITYNVDVEKSSVGWHARKVTGEHFGMIKISKGEIFSNKGLLTGGAFDMDMTSIIDTDLTDTGYRTKLEGHLKSEDFFDVAKFPKASFKIKVWAPIKDAEPGAMNYYIKGDLTIKGITKEFSFPALVNPGENTVTALVDFTIDRADFGLKYKSGKYDPGIGDKMIYDEFNLKINLVANRKK